MKLTGGIIHKEEPLRLKERFQKGSIATDEPGPALTAVVLDS